jgi:hypothetical protein
MVGTDAKVAKLAREAGECFERAQRPDGGEYVRVRDGSPAWVTDLVRAAHDDAGMLPDDWRFRTIEEALDAIAEAVEYGTDLEDAGGEFADGTSVYTSDLLAWLGSHLSRIGYVDSARDEFGTRESITDDISMGQYMERREVYGQVLDALRERADDEDEDEDEDEES